MFAAAAPLTGHAFVDAFHAASRGAVQALLSSARSSPRPLEIAARLIDGRGVGVAATPFRADDTMRLLVRVRSAPENGSSRDASLARLVDAHDEGIVVTDASGRVRLANPAFLRWVQMASESALTGQAITQWMAADSLQRLIERVQLHGVAEPRPVQLRAAAGSAMALEMSAVLLTEGDQECIGITLRRRPEPSAEDGGGALVAALQGELAALLDEIGSQDLGQLLRRARALTERGLVQAALQRSDGNAERAALLLGVPAVRVQRHQLPPPREREGGPSGRR